MSIQYQYKATCAVCGTTKEADGEVLANTNWRKTLNGASVLDANAWITGTYGDDCICPDCYTAYKKLQDKADKAQATAQAALKKAGQQGSGTEDDPYVFTANQLLTLAAFYCESAGSEAYAYMPADGTPKTYASWEDALPDMVKF